MIILRFLTDDKNHIYLAKKKKKKKNEQLKEKETNLTFFSPSRFQISSDSTKFLNNKQAVGLYRDRNIEPNDD